MPPEKRRPPPPLDTQTLQSLALRYVERFATSEAKLARYLTRKLRERGWSGGAPADVESVAAGLAALGYVDDRGFGEARARSLERRGYGARRVDQDLRAAGIARDLRTDIAGAVDAEAAAIAYARRRRFGPYGPPASDPKLRQRQFAAMLRAGHDARTVAEVLGGSPLDPTPTPPRGGGEKGRG